MTDHERHEADAERQDRNYGELLQELRVAQTGVQILFAFLLTIAFQQPFTELSSVLRGREHAGRLRSARRPAIDTLTEEL